MFQMEKSNELRNEASNAQTLFREETELLFRGFRDFWIKKSLNMEAWILHIDIDKLAESN